MLLRRRKRFVLVFFTFSALAFLMFGRNGTKSPAHSKTDELIYAFVQNVPEIYYQDHIERMEYNESCAPFPRLLDLKFAGELWQLQQMTNGTLYLYSAYLDDRGFDDRWAVRVMAMYDQIDYNGTFNCRLWFKEVKFPMMVKTDKVIWSFRKGWGGNKTGTFHPYVISCPLNKGSVPMSVSLVEENCSNATNNLKISYKRVEKRDRKNFAVCVKGLNFPYEDRSIRMIEWLEYLFLLGADKVQIYKFEIHPTTDKVLDYYAHRGGVEVTPISVVGGPSNAPYMQRKFLKEKVTERRLQEVVTFNDCLYRNLQGFRYVVLLDTDEVIVPVEGTWGELVAGLEKHNRTSYVARNVYFMDSHLHEHDWFGDIPRYLHMLQHVYRSENYTKPGHFVKGFHDTGRVLALHNHFAIACQGGCKHHSIDLQLAHLQHYRTTCVKGVKGCAEMQSNSVMDARIWNFKDRLMKNFAKVIDDLNFLLVQVP